MGDRLKRKPENKDRNEEASEKVTHSAVGYHL